MRETTPPDRPWLAMEFFCGACGGGVMWETTDLGSRLHKPPRIVNGQYQAGAQCPYCAKAATFRTREGNV